MPINKKIKYIADRPTDAVHGVDPSHIGSYWFRHLASFTVLFGPAWSIMPAAASGRGGRRRAEHGHGQRSHARAPPTRVRRSREPRPSSIPSHARSRVHPRAPLPIGGEPRSSSAPRYRNSSVVQNRNTDIAGPRPNGGNPGPHGGPRARRGALGAIRVSARHAQDRFGRTLPPGHRGASMIRVLTPLNALLSVPV